MSSHLFNLRYFAFFLLFFGVFITVNAQEKEKLNTAGFKEAIFEEPVIFSKPAPESREDAIWYESFSETSSQEWEFVDLAGNGGWEHTFSGSQGQFAGEGLPINSPSSEDGFMILDADLINTPYDPGNPIIPDAYIQSPAIDLGDHSYVILEFYHYFRYFSGAELLVGVSTDGENWTEWNVKGNVGVNQFSPNPLVEQINISEVAGGANEVYIRFHFRGSHWYFWQVDDVSIKPMTANDLSVERVKTGLYHRMPEFQALPFRFKGIIENLGSATQTNAYLEVDINEGLFTAQSEVFDAPYQFYDTVIVPETFLPQEKGQYDVVFTVNQDQEDDHPENNVYEQSFFITDTVYARDNDVLTGGAHAGTGEPYIMALMYEVPQPAQPTSVSFVLSSLNQPGVVGREVRVVLYEITEELDAITLGASELYTITSDDIPQDVGEGPVSVTLPLHPADGKGDEIINLKKDRELPEIGGYYLDGPLKGMPKQYLAAFQQFGGTPTIFIGTGPASYQPSDIWYMFTDQWYAIYPDTRWPMVRFNVKEGECPWLFVDAEITDATGMDKNDGSIVLTDLDGGEPPYTFLWDDPDASTTQNIHGLYPGDYTVLITDANDCEWERVFTVSVTTGIFEPDAISSLEVFPNPVKDRLQVRFFMEKPGSLDVGLYSLTGNKLFSKSREDFTGDFETDFSMGNLPSGVYLLKIEANGQAVTRKILKN